MEESNQLATSFIIPFGMYCYITMSFGLRNAGATYQRYMLHMFKDHIGRTVDVYVDDIVVKSSKADGLVADLRIAFDCLRAKRVKLNPEKCVFGVPRGMLLGLIVSQWGIEPNPDLQDHAWPAGPTEHRHATSGRRYTLQRRPRRLLGLSGRRRDLCKAEDDAQDS